jgi:prolyl-tRNA editing enzyme YbaK/EbsC (Cys-tRNA(Pro) deacylase)
LKPAENKTARRVQTLLGSEYQVVEFEHSTRSAADAAKAIGCEVRQIAKSLVFRQADERPVLIIACGDNRVDEQKAAAVIDDVLYRADADFVKSNSGFSIGGVAPVGHRVPPIVILDHHLENLDIIWAAAGTPNSVFCLTPKQLAGLTHGTFEDIAE